VRKVPPDKLPYIYLACGTEDRLLQTSRDLHKRPFTYSESLGGHSEPSWAREVGLAMAVQDAILRRATAAAKAERQARARRLARPGRRFIMPKYTLWIVAISLSLPMSPAAADTPVEHRIMLAGYGKSPNRLVEVSADGRLLWQHRFPSTAVIFQVLKDGHVLYGYGGHPTGVQGNPRSPRRLGLRQQVPAGLRLRAAS
jgi:hypothetical protein